MRKPGKTPPFRASDGSVVTDSIAEAAFLTLGGFDQWVLVRGRSIQNPPLILLYGGPGLSETALFRYFNAALEESFSVVYWDQRGSGKSFYAKPPASTMTLEQFTTDLDELIEAVRRQVGKQRVTIFGHSWGSVLGVLYAARFPEKVSAYVGSGQIGSWPAAESASYAFALKEAERQNNRKALRDLRAMGPPPYDSRSLWTERTWLQRLERRLTPGALLKLARVQFAAKESSLLEVFSLFRALRFSLDVMWDDVSKINLLELIPALQVPVFFFLGRQDHWVPPETSVEFFDALEAPSKKLVWFEESGHEVFMDEPAKFNAAMVEFVLPATTATG